MYVKWYGLCYKSHQCRCTEAIPAVSATIVHRRTPKTSGGQQLKSYQTHELFKGLTLQSLFVLIAPQSPSSAVTC